MSISVSMSIYPSLYVYMLLRDPTRLNILFLLRIRLSDAAAKLSLDHPDDMESITAKAIRDGVIDASINHAEGVLISRGAHDTYSTLEPQVTICICI